LGDPSEVAQKNIPEEFRIVSELIGAGKFSDAFEGLNFAISKNDLNKVGILINVAGFYIDIGDGLNDPNIVMNGITILENNKTKIFKVSRELEFTYWYDLGNGYASLYRIERKTIGFKYSLESIANIQKSKNCYYKSSVLLKDDVLKQDKEQIASLYTNLGNSFDNLGRNIEAIECFNLALTHFPDHPMALANKAKNYCFLIYFTEKENYSKLYYEAYWLLRKACESSMMEEAPRKYFESNYLNPLTKLLSGRMNLEKKEEHTRIWKRKYKSSFRRFYVNFCIENRLYLNPHSFYCDCSASIGDPIIIQKMLVTAERKDGYLTLSRFLNQVKQEYVTARFMLSQSQFKDPKLKFIDEKVLVLNTLDYVFVNIYQELLKFSFRLAFSALDKIAFFINEYLELVTQERIYFKNIWFKDLDFKKGLNEKLTSIDNNVALAALYDISQDFGKDGQYEHLAKIRNYLEHKYLKVVLINSPLPSVLNDGINKDELIITETELFQETIKLFQIVRSALIYLIHLVWIEERKKEKAVGSDKAVPLFAMSIPDKMKYF
jgi:tetratricopeptide (TPR) repeat protein